MDSVHSWSLGEDGQLFASPSRYQLTAHVVSSTFVGWPQRLPRCRVHLTRSQNESSTLSVNVADGRSIGHALQYRLANKWFHRPVGPANGQDELRTSAKPSSCGRDG
ncbi:hypothetical protein VTK26DRAFT_1098 [Humicola hyalothermophila]